MAFCDFVVRFDPQKDSGETLTKRVLYSVIVKRLQHKKPAVMFVGGDSGEGKSMSCLRLQEILCEMAGVDINQYYKEINVFTPLQYPEKIERLLFDKDLKKVNIICMHEAREVVKAKNWQSFLTQSVGDVNAMSRSVKRLCFMIVSQFIRDISNDIRYTLNYYCIVRRPKGKKARLYINVMWKDDRDLEKPKLRRRKLSGYLILPGGRYKRYVPRYLELSKPNKELIQKFEAADYDAKAGIIKNKLNKLLKEMKDDVGEQSKKIDVMIKWYSENITNLQMIGKKHRGKWKVKPEFREMHELSKEEAQNFETRLNEELTSKGLIDKL